MLVSQKCQYALRAIFELSRRCGQGPVKNSEIAKAQAIPPRFLEVILSQLGRAGFVTSKRGSAGGYFLARKPDQMTVGQVIFFMQGPVGPVDCVSETSRKTCSLRGKCVFLAMWEKAREAVSAVYDNTSFQDLLEQEERAKREFVPCYSI